MDVSPAIGFATTPRRGHSKRARVSKADAKFEQPVSLGPRVLVVDADLSSAKHLSQLIRGEGADVHVVHSAEEALPILYGKRPRAVVLDLVLPRMSGLLLVQLIKAEPWGRDIVILAVTAINGPEGERVALDAGCAAYIRKPVNAQDFVRTWRTELERAQGTATTDRRGGTR
jgi:CheY-like chemotaxis protein